MHLVALHFRFLPLLLVAASCFAGSDLPHRSKALRAEFMHSHPCPSTGRTSGACPGYQVDHRQALICGGKDELGNLQWLDVATHKAKTREEVRRCRRPQAESFDP